jgi:phage terminase large subunit-like protein
MMSMGKVFWPKHAPWKAEVQNQMLRFPAGKHDDAVDVLSLLARGHKFVGASKKPVKRRVFESIGSWMAG